MKQVRLRAVEPEDLETLFRYENDRGLWAVGSTLAPYSRKQIYDYVAQYSADIYAERQLRLMVDDAETGVTVGTADLTDFSPADMRAQVGLLIDGPFQRQGYGSATLAALTEYASKTLQLHQLYAIVPADNIASLAVFRRAGFRTGGRLRSWLRRGGTYGDAIFLQRLFP